ncbi:hypothetical protein ACSBR2_006791 [Camellia fascicularis]
MLVHYLFVDVLSHFSFPFRMKMGQKLNTGLNGVVNCGARHEHIYKRTMLLTEQVRVSKGSPIVTCLLEGPSVLRLQWQLLLVLTTIFPMSRY